MARTLSRQVRLLPPTAAGTDPMVDDGEPYHSRLIYDMPTDLNNLATYVEPSFQFFMAQSYQSNQIPFAPQTWWIRAVTAIPTSGQAFIAQGPIIVPHQAKRLLWTLDMYRGNFNAIEGTASAQVTAITLYLSPTPLRNFLPTQLGVSPASPNDYSGNFDDTCMPGKFGKHTLPVSFTSISGSPVHDFADDTATGWIDFAKDPNLYMSAQALLGAPMCWIIVAATYNSAAQYDYIRAREFSLWGVYE